MEISFIIEKLLKLLCIVDHVQQKIEDISKFQSFKIKNSCHTCVFGALECVNVGGGECV